MEFRSFCFFGGLERGGKKTSERTKKRGHFFCCFLLPPLNAPNEPSRPPKTNLLGRRGVGDEELVRAEVRRDLGPPDVEAQVPQRRDGVEQLPKPVAELDGDDGREGV